MLGVNAITLEICLRISVIFDNLRLFQFSYLICTVFSYIAFIIESGLHAAQKMATLYSTKKNNYIYFESSIHFYFYLLVKYNLIIISSLPWLAKQRSWNGSTSSSNGEKVRDLFIFSPSCCFLPRKYIKNKKNKIL